MHDGKSKRKYSHTLEMIQPAESGAWVRSYFLVCVALYRRVQQFSPHHAMRCARCCCQHLQVGIHSALANKLTRKLLEEKKVPGVDSYTSEDVQPEVPIQPFLRKGKNTSKRPQGGKTSSAPGKTRVDFRIQHTDESYTFLEVKSVTFTQECVPYQLSEPEITSSLKFLLCDLRI